MKKIIKIQDFCETTMKTKFIENTVDELSNQINNEILNKFHESIELAIGMNINKETCLKWIEQQMKMDNFSEQQIIDICTQEYVEKLYNEINELKEQIKQKDEIIDRIKEILI